MKIESKQKRIDSDRGYLVLRPDEYARLGKNLGESDGFDFAEAYRASVGRIAEARRLALAKTAEECGFSLDDEAATLAHMPEFCARMGDAVGRMFGRSRIRFVDWGSFKFVAVFDCGAALKVGLRDEGLRDEVENALNFPKLTCFPRLLGHDGKTWSSCAVEAVDPKFGDPECARFYGVAMHTVVDLLTGAAPDGDSERRFLENLRSGKGAKWDSVRDLKTFFDEFRPLYDVSYGNWGLAKRGGQDVPVVLDYDI